MLNPPLRHMADGAPSEPVALRQALGLAALLYALFIVYGSLVPLEPVALPWDEAWRRFLAGERSADAQGSRIDVAVNMGLTVPLALLLRAALQGASASPGRRLWWSLLTLLVCALLSVAVEFAQVFFPARSAAWSDVGAQWLGAVLGLGLHAWRGQALRQWASQWWTAQHGAPMAQWWLRAWLLGLAASALVPLDLTISPVELFHKWREGRVVLRPFADLPTGTAAAIWEIASDALLWAPVGVLWRLQGRSLRQTVARGALAAAAIEAAQLLVFSRVTSSTDVIVGAMGCLLGGGALALGWPPRLAPSVPARPGAAQAAGHRTDALAPQRPDARKAVHPWGWALLVWAVVVPLLYWFPFDFGGSPDAWAARARGALSRVPFEVLYQGSVERAVAEMLRKVLLFVPGGLLWVGWRRGRPGRHDARWLALPLAALLALLIEAVQLALPTKVADLTDAGLSTLGAALGLLVGQRLWMRPGPVATPNRSPPTAASGTASASASASALVANGLGLPRPGVQAWFLAGGALLAALAVGAAWGRVPAGYLFVWSLAALVAAWAPRWPLAGIGALVLVVWLTPRYREDLMGALLGGPLLPGLALLAGSGWLLALRARGCSWRLRVLPDGGFLLFFAWIAGVSLWHALRPHAPAIEALYHPAGYALAALAYAMARTDASRPGEQRALAMALAAGVAVVVADNLWQATFALNGQVALLVALALPWAHGLQRSAGSDAGRLGWACVLAAGVAAVLLSRNRSAALAVGALALLWVMRSPSPRVRWSAAALGIAALAGWALWGGLDRFAALWAGWHAEGGASDEVTGWAGRRALWSAAIGLVADAPLAGVGLGRFEAALRIAAPQVENVPAHNTWLSLLVEGGVPALLFGAFAFLMAAITPPAGDAPGTSARWPGWSMRTVALEGLLVWLIFGLFNSRQDFTWAYALAGWAVGWPAIARAGRARHRRSP